VTNTRQLWTKQTIQASYIQTLLMDWLQHMSGYYNNIIMYL